jgi:hypothetical protein
MTSEKVEEALLLRHQSLKPAQHSGPLMIIALSEGYRSVIRRESKYAVCGNSLG